MIPRLPQNDFNHGLLVVDRCGPRKSRRVGVGDARGVIVAPESANLGIVHDASQGNRGDSTHLVDSPLRPESERKRPDAGIARHQRQHVPLSRGTGD